MLIFASLSRISFSIARVGSLSLLSRAISAFNYMRKRPLSLIQREFIIIPGKLRSCTILRVSR